MIISALRNTLFVLLFASSLFLFNCSSDDAVEMEPQEMEQEQGDENPPPLPTGDPDEIIVRTQQIFHSIFESLNGSSMPLVRQAYMFGNYNGAITPNNTTNLWQNSYEILENTTLLNALNEQPDYNVPQHLGVAQLLQAFSFFYMADFLGDVPFTEANNVQMFPDPNPDSAESIYDTHLNLLDLAIINLNLSGSNSPEDVFFEGGFNKNNWIALANSLKIRAYTNLRLISPTRAKNGINAAISSNYISEINKDFHYRYRGSVPGTSAFEHPLYFLNYQHEAISYQSNSLFNFMNVGDNLPPFEENGIIDPRARYYFYRQSDDHPQGSNLPCEGNPDYTYCYVGNLYWGRDHGDDEGIPNDGLRKTTYGIYPAGGAFDSNLYLPTPAVVPISLEGNGISPILLSSQLNFLLAETALTIGVSGNPATYLENGIQQSMNKVLNFPGAAPTVNPDTGIDYAASQADVNAYVTRVLQEFNSASNDEKLTIISRELYIASFGNGIEIYNLYRRTGRPDFVTSLSNNGTFPRIYLFPQQFISQNPNISQNSPTTQTFWDVNPAGFID